MVRGAYIWKRITFAAATIVIAITFNFILFRVLPGSAVNSLAKVPNASPHMKQQLAEQFGLNKPLWEQYVYYLRELFRGNLGISFSNRQPVAQNLMESLGNTIPLVASGTIIALILGLAVGVYSAVRRGTPTEIVSTNLAVLFYAFPTQFLGMMLLIVFAGLFPTAGMSDPFAVGFTFWQQLGDRAAHLVLPVATLVLTLYAESALIVRSAMLETLGEDYILTARAKGLKGMRIISRYALRNAMLPTITQMAMSLGSIVTGAILIEVIFSWPGIGRSLYEAVISRDYPMLQGGFLVITVSVVLFNFIADLLYYRLDPRLTR